MAEKTLKYVKAGYSQGTPAEMYFYSDVDEWNVEDFIYTFQYLQNYVNPSKIIVHIVSVGGSCFEGIKVVSMLLNSTIPVETVNDGFAASMASVIWAAGGCRHMMDYAVLMIHNPYIDTDYANASPDDKVIIDTWKTMMKTIYKNRLGLSDEEITAIMDGEEGVDGTYLFAQDCVDKGFLPAENVISSNDPALAGAVAKCVKETNNAADVIRLIKAKLPVKDVRLGALQISGTQDNTHNQNENTMDNNEFKMVAAQLGLTGEKATGMDVTARVNELLDKEKHFDGVQAELDTVKAQLTAKDTELAGANASVENLKKNLEDVQAQLKVFTDAEAAKRDEEITAMVDKAIKEGKIAEASKGTWMNLAKDNFELAKATLDGIQARVKVSEQIAKDPENAKAAEEGMKDQEAQVAKEVEKVVGKDFKFRKMGE